MDNSNSATLAPTSEQILPAWIVDRAAAYMMRRYGTAALRRAASRRRFLLRAGDDLAAAHWMRVAEAIAASAGRKRKVETV